MSKIRRVDFSPDEWLAGTRELTLEERGAYWDVCSLMYSRGGAIADDDAWVAKALSCNPRTWRAIKARLIKKGKLRIEADHIINLRTVREIQKAENRVNSARIGSEKSANARRTRVENAGLSLDFNDIPEATAHTSAQANYQLPTIKEESKEESPPLEAAPLDPPREEAAAAATGGDVSRADEDEAFSQFQAAASRLGWPNPPMFLDSARRPMLRDRLVECGGISGWSDVLKAAEISAFLRGPDGNSWQWWFTFNWILKQQNFVKLMEGNYAERHRRSDDADERSTGAALAGVFEAGSR